MASAIVPTLVQELSGVNVSVMYPISGTAGQNMRLVYINATATATDDTIALATYMPGITGVVGVLMNVVDAATSSTTPTWSTTTLTLAQYAGSGVCEMILLVE